MLFKWVVILHIAQKRGRFPLRGVAPGSLVLPRALRAMCPIWGGGSWGGWGRPAVPSLGLSDAENSSIVKSELTSCLTQTRKRAPIPLHSYFQHQGDPDGPHRTPKVKAPPQPWRCNHCGSAESSRQALPHKHLSGFKVQVRL